MSGISSNCFGMLVRFNNVIVSTEIGLFQLDDGETVWEAIDEYVEKNPIHQFIVDGFYIFALAECNIWRKLNTDSEYTMVASLNCNEARRFVIFDDGGTDRLMVATDNGIHISSDDIKTSSAISFDEVGVPDDNSNRGINIATSLNVIGSNIYIGSDNQFSSGVSNLNNVTKVFEESSVITPSIYVDKNRREIGAYYSIPNNSVSFDIRIDDSSIVSVANQYMLYKIKNTTWFDQKYDSVIGFKRNYASYYDNIGATTSAVEESLSSVSFDDFTEDNSNLSRANGYIADYGVDLLRLQNVIAGTEILTGDETIYDVVGDIVDDFYKVYAQRYKKVRFFVDAQIDSVDYKIIDYDRFLASTVGEDFSSSEYDLVEMIPAVSPSISVFESSKNEVTFIDASSGIFVFENNFDKYDVISITLEGTSIRHGGIFTHEELEDDVFEIIDSGLSTALSEVQQSNIVNMGIFLEETYPDEQENNVDECGVDLTTPVNSKYIISTDSNWYDTLNSTVDYIEEKSIIGDYINVDYVLDAKYFDDEGVVLIAHFDCFVSMDKDDFSLSNVVFDADANNSTVNNILIDDDDVYIVTRSNIYKTQDLSNWERIIIRGITGDINKIDTFKGNLVVSTDDGIFYKESDRREWHLVLSTSDVTNMLSTNLLYVVDNDELKYSLDGFVWNSSGLLNDQINDMVKYKVNIAMGSNTGLRYDNTTFPSGNAQTSVVDVLGNLTASELLVVNSVALKSDGISFVAFANNGSYYTTTDGSTFSATSTGLTTIHKGLYVDNDILSFGYGLLKVSSESDPIKISNGKEI